MQLEKQIANLPEQEKQTYRARLAEEETLALKESRKKTTTADFESLAVIGRGAFGTLFLCVMHDPPVFLMSNCMYQISTIVFDKLTGECHGRAAYLS